MFPHGHFFSVTPKFVYERIPGHVLASNSGKEKCPLPGCGAAL
jgi:hypothetical protein